MQQLSGIVRLLRINQWVKNLFVLAPLFFSGRFMEHDLIQSALLAVLAFCLAASAVYVLNDLRDVESDRQHPEKKHRPIAAGSVPVPLASVIAIIFAVAALFIAYSIGTGATAIIATYLIMNVGYSLGLKHVSVLDVFFVAFGFVLRVAIGGVATGIIVSHWLIIMTFLLALFLAFGKRRDDLAIAVEKGITLRRSIKGYSLAFVDMCMGLLTSVLLMSYILYCLSPDVLDRANGHLFYISAIFVLAGMFRYLQITMVEKGSYSPTKVLYTDRFIQGAVLSWVLFFVYVLYA